MQLQLMQMQVSATCRSASLLCCCLHRSLAAHCSREDSSSPLFGKPWPPGVLLEGTVRAVDVLVLDSEPSFTTDNLVFFRVSSPSSSSSSSSSSPRLVSTVRSVVIVGRDGEKRSSLAGAGDTPVSLSRSCDKSGSCVSIPSGLVMDDNRRLRRASGTETDLAGVSAAGYRLASEVTRVRRREADRAAASILPPFFFIVIINASSGG